MHSAKMLWMPPMQRVVELIERHGIKGGEASAESVICLGDLGRVEHLIHELAHAALLDIVVDGDSNLSSSISSELGARAEAQQDDLVPSRYELETFAAEHLVIERLGIPVTRTEIIDGLVMQVGRALGDPVERFEETLDSDRVVEAADEVCKRLANGGTQPEMRSGIAGAVFWRLTEDGYEITVYPMTFGNARICISESGSDAMLDAWCYQSDRSGDGLSKAVRGASEWDGKGNDPPGGWYRNPQTGRRREGGDATKELVRW